MEIIDPRTAYRAVAARDARFDGRLFVGVTSTGVYCRPICRVRTPRRENCRFFATPAQAEAEAFRPCMKCRPEIAPGPGLAWSVMDASSTLARQAADAIDTLAGGDETGGLTAVAARIGVTDRHLRRIFAAEHGVTPVQYLRTRRLLHAKQLLTDTRLPVAQIALQCGYRSLRRFNAAFAESYRMNPTRLRGGRDDADGPDAQADVTSIVLTLAHRVPYDTASLLRFVEQRAIPGVEVVEAGTVRRSVRAGVLDAAAGWIEVRFETTAACVRVRFPAAWSASTARIAAAVRRWLDLDAAPDVIDAALVGLPAMPGLRLPGSIDAFELAVRAVLGQQVTVAAARTLARRFVDRFGTPMVTPWPDVTTVFPAAATIARTPVERIAELGIIRTRAEAIVAIATAWPEIEPLLAPRAAPEPLIERLTALPGIGPWTAHYIAMRALGWPDAFPPGDVAAIKAMAQRFGTATPRAADTHAQAWRPWRAYALLNLWKTLEGPAR